MMASRINFLLKSYIEIQLEILVRIFSCPFTILGKGSAKEKTSKGHQG